MNDRELGTQIEKMIRMYRVVGWIVLSAGACVLPFVVIGVIGTTGPTFSKAGSIALAAFIPLFGALCVFMPKKKLESNIRRVFGLAMRPQIHPKQ